MKSAAEILTSSKKFHISLGLERVKKILDLLDNPQDKYHCFHIAGTNGKGSVSKIINDILVENFKNSDTKIGLFTSPHLFSYTERIKIDNIDIANYTFDKLIGSIDDFAKKNGVELTEFELITVCAFYYFYLKKVKYVILETGLGGTYDATNIIKKPIVEVITTIDYDHTERLGKTIEEIASQKAGIIKEGTSVVISEKNLGYKTVLNAIKEKKAILKEIPKIEILYENNTNYAVIKNGDTEKKYEFNLAGKHQGENLALALGAINASKIKISKKAITEALKKVKWKFRLEYNKAKNILIDGAHNPSGIKTLRDFLDENYKNEKISIIFGCLKNKDYKKMLETLVKEQDDFYFYEFDYPNSLKFDELEEKYRKKAVKIKTEKETEDLINGNTNLKVICGSLYMLGKLGKIL